MDSCDVLIVGGGPAGSSCAWALRDAGLDIAILDKSAFPRDKVCGGWITPEVLEELQIDAGKYRRGRVLQPITGFRTSSIGGPEVETDYGHPISYGIRRCEFDAYLLARCGARILPPAPLKTIARSGTGWLVNSRLKARLLIGAGGHFCPVARHLGAGARNEVAVAAQEIEFEMDAAQRSQCSLRGEFPELFFCQDMKGYGWCFRKGDYLNIGLGRLDQEKLPRHVAKFIDFLRSSGKIAFDLQSAMRGHAYLIYREAHRQLIGDAAMLIGDAAGLAYSQSGEGIRPAIESGLLAAKTIIDANGDYSQAKLASYPDRLASRFGNAKDDWSTAIGRRLPTRVMSAIARVLLTSGWFSRHIVLDRWFLHRNVSALATSPQVTRARALPAA
jgi:menaquinone-9 beta-reductase